MITTVLWDLDNVLVDTVQFHKTAFTKAVSKVMNYNIPESVYDDMGSITTKDKIAVLRKDIKINNDEYLDILTLKREYCREEIANNLKFDYDKITLHIELQKLGYILGCVTNNNLETATLSLSKTGQLRYMEILIANDHVKKHKPHPDCYELAIKKLGIRAVSAVAIEDSAEGVQAARAAGLNFIKVGNPSEVTWEKMQHTFKSLRGIT